MHELSVAQSVVELVSETLFNEAPARVVSVRLRVGPLSGVVPQALRFAWDAATAGTKLDGAALHVDEVIAAAYCGRCDRQREVPDVTRLRCPVCSQPVPDIVRGRELEITSVEVTDGQPGNVPKPRPRPGRRST